MNYPDKTDITFLIDIFKKLIGDRVEDPVNFRDHQFISGYTGTKGGYGDAAVPLSCHNVNDDQK